MLFSNLEIQNSLFCNCSSHAISSSNKVAGLIYILHLVLVILKGRTLALYLFFENENMGLRHRRGCAKRPPTVRRIFKLFQSLQIFRSDTYCKKEPVNVKGMTKWNLEPPIKWEIISWKIQLVWVSKTKQINYLCVSVV